MDDDYTPDQLRRLTLGATTADQYARTLRRLTRDGLPWPPTTDDVCELVAARVNAGRTSSTIKADVAAIRAGLADKIEGWKGGPPLGQRTGEVMRGASKATTPGRGAARPLRAESLRAAVDSAELVRDRALLVVGWVGGLRREELVGLNCDDGEITPGGLELRLRESKRRSEPVWVRLPAARDRRYCPARLWSALVGKRAGPLPAFLRRGPGGAPTSDRLGAQSVRLILKRCLVAAGLDDRLYTAHSLRAGVASEASAAGVPLDWSRDHLRHRSLATTAGYVRGVPWERNPAAGLLDNLDEDGRMLGQGELLPV